MREYAKENLIYSATSLDLWSKIILSGSYKVRQYPVSESFLE